MLSVARAMGVSVGGSSMPLRGLHSQGADADARLRALAVAAPGAAEMALAIKPVLSQPKHAMGL